MKLLSYFGWRLLAFLVLLGSVEAYLWTSTKYGQLVVTERSERFGWRMLPSQSRWSREGDVPEVINAFGYRDREWDSPRSEGDGWAKDGALMRVAVLGQSMTYGTSVAIEETWPRALEERLTQHLADRGDARQALVMNFAVQGYVLEQMERVYLDDAAPFRPDVLIVPLHMGDILPMPPTRDEFDFRYRRPWFRTATRDFLNREVVGKWMPRPKPPVSQPGADTGGLKNLLREDPRNKTLQPYWAAAADRLKGLQERVESGGGRLVLAILPIIEHLIEVEPKRPDPSIYWDLWVERRAQVRPESPPIPVLSARAEFARAQETLSRDIVARFGPLPILPSSEKGLKILPPDLKGYEERLFLEQDVGHYSPRGHKLLGETVFEQGLEAGAWD
ncbi:MAG: hypothetical protein AAF682_03240 [Planctomycetota bacterium]